MRRRAWGLLVVVLVAVFAVVNTVAPFSAFHLDLYLAGTPSRFVATVVKAGRSDARAALWLDNLFVVAWLLMAPRLLHAGVVRWAPERRRSFGVWRATPTLAVCAGLLDLVENVFSLAMVGKERPPTGLVLIVTTIAWAKWIVYLVSVVGLVALVVGPLLAPAIRPLMRRVFAPLDRLAGEPRDRDASSRDAMPVERAPVERAPADFVSGDFASGDFVSGDDVPSGARVGSPGPAIGICVSGGGMPAAAVAMGALRRFDAGRDDGPSLFLRSSWLVAVDGGAYTAAGWFVTRGTAPRSVRGITGSGPGRDGSFDADHPFATRVRARRRFLDNGSLSIVGGVLNLLARSLLVLGGLFAAVHLAAAFVGRAVRSHAIHRDFPFLETAPGQLLHLRDLVPLRLVLPGAVLLVAAGVLALAAYSRSGAEQRSRLTAPAWGFTAAGSTLSVLLVVVPIGIVYGRRLLRAAPLLDGADPAAALIAMLALLALVPIVWWARTAREKQPWLLVARGLVGLLLLLYAGKILDALSFDYTSGWTSWPLPGTDERLPVWVVAVVWLVVLECVPAHRRTLAGMYRKRLAATFTVTVDGHGAATGPVALGAERAWAEYDAGAPGPELVVATTAHTSRDTFCGVPAYAFTFRPGRVTLHDRADGPGAAVPTATYPTGSWWDGYPRSWVASRAMAIGDVAFSSSMGREALEPAGAPLVSLPLRLGAWVPNPRFAHWFADSSTSPRVHLGYLVKELFGRYRPDRDAFVHVADGGHRENLGLVELLRERPDVVCCIDTTDEPSTPFRALGEAIDLALIELGIDIDIDVSPLRRHGSLPLDCAAEGIVHYPAALGGGTARLLYGRAQLSEAAPAPLLQYGAVDDRFPQYGTADQFLSPAEYDQLVALGEHVGERIVGLFDGAKP